MRVVAGVHVMEIGDRVDLSTDGYVDSVTVTALMDGGQRVAIRFDSGAALIVPVAMLGTHRPAHYRHRTSDPDTSRQAADIDYGTLTHTQVEVLKALAAAGTRGMIDHDHQAVNGLGQDTAGKRRGELCDLFGAVADSGLRRKTPRGRNAIVWRITPTGVALLNDLHRRGVA